MNARITVEAGLRSARDTYRALLATYVDPNDERAVAVAPVPDVICDALTSARVTVEHLTNALEFGEW